MKKVCFFSEGYYNPQAFLVGGNHAPIAQLEE